MSQPVIALALAPPLAALGVALGQPFAAPRLLFMDPAEARAVADPCCGPHLGLMSNIGVALLALAGAAALCAALAPLQARARGAAALAGLFSLWLAADDLLMLHEAAAARFGVSEIALQGAYCLGGLAVWRQHRLWIAPGVAPVLFLALAFLGASVSLDLAVAAGALALPAELQARIAGSESATVVLLLEDGAKFVGFWLWAFAFGAAALACTRTAVQPARALSSRASRLKRPAPRVAR